MNEFEVVQVSPRFKMHSYLKMEVESMRQSRRRPGSGVFIAVLLSVIAQAPITQGDTVLSDNIADNPTAGSESTVNSVLAASFGTDGSNDLLTSVTLLLANPLAGSAELQIYSDGGLQPGAFVGTLTSPSTYTSGLSDTTFTATDITLSADSTYWAVLTATSGEFDWSWTDANTGNGAGFQGYWAESADGGSTWVSYVGFPLQMIVSTESVPEPGSMVLGGIAAALLLMQRAYQRRIASARCNALAIG